MESYKTKDNIQLNLSNDEALVLLHWLFRFNEIEHPDLFEDQAEQRVLYDLEAVLEDVVDDIVDTDYNDYLVKARKKIRDED